MPVKAVVGLIAGLLAGLIPVNTFAVVDFIRVSAFNAQSVARGGNSIAVCDSPGNLNLNPATICETDGHILDSSLSMLLPIADFTYTGTNSKRYTSTSKDRRILAPGIHYAYKPKNSRVAYGFSFAIPEGSGADYTIQSKYFGPVNAFSEYIHIRTGPAISYDVTPQLTVGARVGLDYMTMDIRMPLGRIYLDNGECEGWGASFGLGLIYRFTQNFRVGLYYEPSSIMNHLKSRDGNGFLEFDALGTSLQFPNLNVTMKDLESAMNYGIGVTYEPASSFRLSVDVKYINWSRNWDEFSIRFSGDEADGLLLKEISLPLKVDDQVTFGFGIEYFMSEYVTFIAGYHYNDDAVPNTYFNPLLPGEIEQSFTLGASLEVEKKIKISVATSYGTIDHPEVDGNHGYDEAVENQLNLPAGTVESELSGGRLDLDGYSIFISISYFL